MNLSHNGTPCSNQKCSDKSRVEPIASSGSVGGESENAPEVGAGGNRPSGACPKSPARDHRQDRSAAVGGYSAIVIENLLAPVLLEQRERGHAIATLDELMAPYRELETTIACEAQLTPEQEGYKQRYIALLTDGAPLDFTPPQKSLRRILNASIPYPSVGWMPGLDCETTFCFSPADPYLAREIGEYWCRRVEEERQSGRPMVPIEQYPPSSLYLGTYERPWEPFLDPDKFHAIKEALTGVLNSLHTRPLRVSEDMPSAHSVDSFQAIPPQRESSEESALTFPHEFFEKLDREVQEKFGPRRRVANLTWFRIKWPPVDLNQGAQPQIENLVGHIAEQGVGSFDVGSAHSEPTKAQGGVA